MVKLVAKGQLTGVLPNETGEEKDPCGCGPSR